MAMRPVCRRLDRKLIRLGFIRLVGLIVNLLLEGYFVGTVACLSLELGSAEAVAEGVWASRVSMVW
jgi:hypothetical protein